MLRVKTDQSKTKRIDFKWVIEIEKIFFLIILMEYCVKLRFTVHIDLRVEKMFRPVSSFGYSVKLQAFFFSCLNGEFVRV